MADVQRDHAIFHERSDPPKLRDLLFPLFIPSAGGHLPNSVDRLCKLMTHRSQKLGQHRWRRVLSNGFAWECFEFRRGRVNSRGNLGHAQLVSRRLFGGIRFRHSKSRCTMISTHFPSSRILTAHAAF